jgi:hypothetical protein
MASVEHGEPSDEPIAQAARRAEYDQETAARDAESAGCKHKWGERNGRRKHGGKKDGENRMTLDPCDDAGAETRRHIAVHRRFATTKAHEPCGVSAEDAAGDGGEGKQPGISLVRDKQKQQKVSAAGDGQRDDR